TFHYGNDFSASCYTTADGARNHFEIHLSQDSVDLWATDAGATNLRRVASKTGLSLPFTQGYVSFAHTHYNAQKGGGPADQHYDWANMGFDGPIVAPARGYDVPNALVSNSDGSVRLSYHLNGGAMPGSPTF